jgi:hypothetical protein
LRLFGRREAIHRTLADAGGLSLEGDAQAPRGQAADAPGWDGEQRGEPGIHGVPRARRWDVVATAEAPDALGDELAFTTLPDGTLLVDDDQPDGALAPLADAVEATLTRPYRAEAVRRGPVVWAVAGRRIAVVEQAGLDGEEAQLVSSADGRTLTVDGLPLLARTAAFEAAGERAGRQFVVRATRLDGDLWEVEASPL